MLAQGSFIVANCFGAAFWDLRQQGCQIAVRVSVLGDNWRAVS